MRTMSTFLVSENWRRLQALKERKNRAGLREPTWEVKAVGFILRKL